MKPNNTMSGCLISCRNILLGGGSNKNVLDCLEDVLENVDLITVTSTKKIVGRCVSEAIDQIEDSDFVSAGMILNLIHNLPLNEESEQRWNINYFLSIELPTFLEHFDEIKSSRAIALYIFGELASKYLPRSG